METRANHLVIGAFVLGVLMLGFGFVYWMQSLGGGAKQYYIVFRGSVAGITSASKVLLNGIQVGRVTDLGLDPQDARKVRVLIAVGEDTPIRENSRASKESMGLTGGSVIQLSAGTPDSPLLVATAKGDIPVIESDFASDASLFEAAPEIMGSAKTLLRQLNELVSENRDSIRNSLNNVESFTAVLNERSGDIDQVIRDARDLTADLRRVSAKMEATVDKVSGYVADDGGFLAEAEEAAKSFRQLAEKLDKSVGDSADGLARFAKDGLQEFELFMRDGRRAARTLDRVLERIERNPQSFLFGGSQVPEYNPGQQGLTR